MKKFKLYILSVIMVIVSSCELDLLDDPNVVTPDSTNPDFLLTQVELNLATFFANTSTFGMEMSRLLNSSQRGATYDAMYQPSTFNGTWTSAYSTTLINSKTLIEIAEESQLFSHAGIAKIIQAYVLMVLVDYFGDVPFSEALDPDTFNPNADSGADIYAAALDLLNEAISDLNNEETLAVPNTIYYGSNMDNWKKLANTLKLRYYITTRLVSANSAAINTLLEEVDDEFSIINSDSESFRFAYGTNIANPDSRHPRFVNNYTTGGNDYMHNFFMWHMIEEGPVKTMEDPRLRYYFYRQVGENPTDVNELTCIGSIDQKPAWYDDNMTYCLPTHLLTTGTDRGYWGRDHMDNSGIPPDGQTRTVWGLYPVGGRYDDNSFSPTNNILLGNQGGGIQPIMMQEYVDFMMAEASLMIPGVNGNPRDFLRSAIEKSMESVRNFAINSREAGTIAEFEDDNSIDWEDLVEDYITEVLAIYDAAGSDDERLEVIAREYWIALHGSGNEAYNLYRRTGKPGDVQPAVTVTDPGAYYLSMKYPDNYVNRNRNASQKPSNVVRVFWDDGSAGTLR